MGWEEYNQVEPGASGWPELILRSAPILKGVTLWILVVAFVLPIVAAAFVMACTGHGRLLLGCHALLGLGLGSVVLCLVTRTGRVALKSDRLIEYNQLGYSRTFTYPWSIVEDLCRIGEQDSRIREMCGKMEFSNVQKYLLREYELDLSEQVIQRSFEKILSSSAKEHPVPEELLA